MKEHPRVDMASAHKLVSSLEPGVFDGTSSVTAWLGSQPHHDKPQLAEALFEKLLCSASHSRDASQKWCVKLCGFVQHCAVRSQPGSDAALRTWAFSRKTAAKLFEFYLDWYEHDPHRSMRLVLDVLVRVLDQNPHKTTSQLVKEDLVRGAVATIVGKSTRPVGKASMQAVVHLVHCNAIGLGDIARAFRDVDPSVATLADLEMWAIFTGKLVSWMQVTQVGSVAGRCTVSIFQCLRKSAAAGETRGLEDFNVGLWWSWLDEAAHLNPAILEDIKKYVLAVLFQTDKASSLELLAGLSDKMEALPSMGGETLDPRLHLQLAVLELGKKCGLVDEPSRCDEAAASKTTIALRENVLELLLQSGLPSVRCSALSLLVSSHSTTKGLSPLAMDLLKKHLPALQSDCDTKLRNDLIAYSNELVKRVYAVIGVASRKLSKRPHQPHQDGEGTRPLVKRRRGAEAGIKDDKDAQDLLNRHSSFRHWYLGFLKGELVPTASYQRHIAAVKMVIRLLGVEKEWKKHAVSMDSELVGLLSSNPAWVRLLLDLMLDPFDDVRETATSLFGMFPRARIESRHTMFGGEATTLLETLETFCDKAAKLATRTGRADHGDGAARSLGLLCRWAGSKERQLRLASRVLDRVEDKLRQAEKDVGRAAAKSPIHGDFSSLRYVWQVLTNNDYSATELQQLQQMQRRILDQCERIWRTVQHVLCHDSPEGHLPEDMVGLDGLDSKNLLSYSFRAVRESSILQRIVVATLGCSGKGRLMPLLAVFKDVGCLAFEQLSNLRHRGAFSAVSLTFATCCELSKNLAVFYPDSSASDNLLRHWYRGALACIMQQTSTTRRSAGIPALMVGILASKSTAPSFEAVFGDLVGIAARPAPTGEADGSNLPQVHALNCLRDVFRSALLAKSVEPYLAPTLRLAVSSLKSQLWAIRNCGLLLLRSLIDSLCGTQGTGHPRRVLHVNYPTLPAVLLDLLGSVDDGTEAVFPALDLLCCAGPPGQNHDEIRRRIEGFLGSRRWHVREMAARTLSSFLQDGDWIAQVERLVRAAASETNRLHGSLLTLRYLVERKRRDAGFDADVQRVGPTIGSLVLASRPFSACRHIRAAYLDVLGTIASINLSTTADALGTTTSALLAKHGALSAMHIGAHSANLATLQDVMLCAVDEDTYTACSALEALASVCFRSLPGARAKLCLLYVRVCRRSENPVLRARALLSLTDAMEQCLLRPQIHNVPDSAALVELWDLLAQGHITPELSCVILRFSGSILATMILRHSQASSDPFDDRLRRQLRSWGVVIRRALDTDNSLDTRLSAVAALVTVSRALSHARRNCHDFGASNFAALLPFHAALYDALNDDDEDLRSLAAQAVAATQLQDGPTVMTPFAAADALLGAWIDTFFSLSRLQKGYQAEESEEFMDFASSKVVGIEMSLWRRFPTTIPSWPIKGGMESPAATNQDTLSFSSGWVSTRLRDAIRRRLDDAALFPAEEQNLYVEEIREMRSWGSAALERVVMQEREQGMERKGLSPSWRMRLRAWTDEGLEYMIGLLAGDAGENDGPLGWASDQHAFAVCARVLYCAGMLVRWDEERQLEGEGEMGSSTGRLLGELRDKVQGTEFHGALMEMMEV